MKFLIILGVLFFSLSSYSAGGSATCHYELYTPAHFDRPVVTPEFKVDLSKVEFTSTEHAALKRILRLQTQPTSLDGKASTHLAFSLTYDGAHSGSIIPMTDGVHVFQIGRDGSDLVGAYLFCDVSGVMSQALALPTYSRVRCVNTKEEHEYSEIIFFNESKRKYRTEFIRRDKSGKSTSESLGIVELNVFQKDLVSMAGPNVVAEFKLPDSTGRAQSARIHLSRPYYESNKWLCKAWTGSGKYAATH